MSQESNNLDLNKTGQPDKPSSGKPEKNTGVLYTLWRSFKLVSRTLVYIPLGLLITLALLIGTHIGSRITVLLAETLVPDLQITYVAGTINDSLVVTDVHWQMPGVAVELDDLTLDWHPLCLLRKQLCVEELVAARVSVDIDTDNFEEDQREDIAERVDLITGTDKEVAPDDSEADAESSLIANQEITLPFGIDLTKADLANIKVRVDDMHFNASRLQAQAQWQETGIRVNSLKTVGLFVDIPLASDHVNTDDQVYADADKPDSKGVVNWAMAKLPQVFMPIPVFAEQVSFTDSHLRLGHRDDLFPQIDFEASYHSFLVHIENLQLEHTYGKVELEGEISLIDDYPMDFTADMNATHVDEIPELERQHASLEVTGGFNKLKITSSGNGHMDYSLTGDIALADPKLTYHLAVTSKQLAWPLDTNTYSAQSVKLKSDGDLDRQQLTFSGQVITPFHPILAIDTQFTHSGSEVEVEHFRAKGKLGEVEVSGHASYGETISWDASINIIDFDMEQLTLPLENPLPESFISGRFNTRGKVENKQWQVAIAQSDLSGEIQGYPFHLIGDLSIDDKLQLSADSLKLSALQSVLTISGTANQNWSVNAILDVPELSLWHPDASGSIKAKINVSGNSDHPEVRVSANALDLQFGHLNLEQALIKAIYQPLDNHEFSLMVRTGEFKHDAIKLDSIRLNIKGNEQEQQLDLHTLGDYILDSQVYSKFNIDTEAIDAKINKLNLSAALGDWSLEAPFNVSWDNLSQTGLVNTFCWLNTHGKLCLDDQVELGANGDASVKFQGDIGAILAPLLPKNMKWQAPAILSSHLIWAKDTKPTGSLKLDFDPGHVSLKNNKRNLELGYKTLSLHASLDEKRLSTLLRFDSQDIASWEGKLDIAVTPDRTLSGYTKLHKVNLRALAGFLPQLETIEGKISSELRIAGTLDEPDVSGKMQLENGELLAAANPTLFEDIKFTVSLLGQDARLYGTWKMGEGQAKLKGNLDWSTGELNGNIQVDGKDLVIIQPPLAIINVSPNLDFIFNKNSFHIKGDIDIPSGHINIVQLPEGGVEVSKDVIFNDSISTGKIDKHPLALTSDIKIKLADNLIIDGMGLRGKLQGVLELKQEAFKPPLLYGDIRVIDGMYKFMGQTLDIKKGEVQFIGPLEVPNLNIEAVREIKDEDVVAGVRITGTPHKPIVTLFSNPSKEQAEILSYIIMGTGFHSNDNQQSTGLMLGAALSLSNQIGGGAVNNIGDSATSLIEKLGFSNVQLDANDDGRVAISGFIGEDLMVKYGHGVFNPGYEMTVRYYLLSQLYLESVSGTLEQTLDIYYNFDID
ncbi:autotransporter assembly complex protein TamB [Shewanella violacea]|uniref:Translocation and assembly module TamB C-terminal domain-containing protein n=2 Tax=Shewanella violacea (strain JCM 10179 / CIP 106290 / LMG 19151 / DSS12) TaxID=637905 RepID=D4ZL80_SHEVD|nr:translocation/assembly module TamB domain-containing protein [Shewanella violacea]BAJ02429.1 conserved hypothetical protein [Shewanella violacea DSS12]